VIALLTATLVSASGPVTAQRGVSCAVTKEFVGTAPSDIVQKKFEARFDRSLNRVDCRDNGLCYQTWGKNCLQAGN
jgi:hypothetical protein